VPHMTSASFSRRIRESRTLAGRPDFLVLLRRGLGRGAGANRRRRDDNFWAADASVTTPTAQAGC
jgi:hypothetical protein